MIHFQNKRFKTRMVDLPTFGEVLISVTSLNDLLLSEEGEYVSQDAADIDSEIFYFVEDNQIHLSDNELSNLLMEEVK